MAEDPTTSPENSTEEVIEDASSEPKSGAEDETAEEEEQLPESWFITGANGNIGQRLIRKSSWDPGNDLGSCSEIRTRTTVLAF